MNKTLLTVGVVALVALAGCSALPSGGEQGIDNGVGIEDNSTGATDVTHSIGIAVDDTTAGEELTGIGATYPREQFTIDSAQHDQVWVGVDTNGDGTAERTFNETHLSGVNNNEFSFDVTMDTGYTLESGDVVMVEYPAVNNPDEPGEYTVEVRLNDRQTTNATAVIG